MRPFIIVIEWHGCGKRLLCLCLREAEEEEKKKMKKEMEEKMCNKKASEWFWR